MEREIVLSSYSVKTGNGKPQNFTTKFTRPITLDSNVCDKNQHIKEITVIKQSNKSGEYPINLEFNE